MRPPNEREIAEMNAALANRQLPSFKWRQAFLEQEDLCEESSTQKKVYLVTFPHPKGALGEANCTLRAPGDLTRQQILAALQDAFACPVYIDGAASARETAAVVLEQCVVYLEKHAENDDGERPVHYHVAVLASRSCRFAAYRRALQQRHKLASHWSDSHGGYWSAVRYGCFPTPKKPSSELDPAPLAYKRGGEHPDLFEAAQEPITAAAIKRRRECKAKKASEEGKPEPRATEMDLYGVIVRQGFRNSPDDQWASKKLIEYLRNSGGVALWSLAWRLRHRLSALIDDVWSWESVSDDLALLSQSRLERFLECARGQCGCNGAWKTLAEWLLEANKLDKVQLCSDIYRSIAHGRHESLKVVVLMGKFGGEGKSFFLAPLRKIYGQEHVQERPQPGNFPLIGLESKRCAILDEWDFDEDSLPLSNQLLWFEGKAFPITRPQNKDYTGHLLYRGTAPIFVTCKEKALGPIIGAAQASLQAQIPCQETMLLRRMRVYSLYEKLPIPEGYQVHECPCCFAQLICRYATAGGS